MTVCSITTAASEPFWAEDGTEHDNRFRSVWLASDDRAVLREGLNELMEECANEGWDGYSAAAVGKDAYEAAWRFINALPNGFEMPHISADPDGCVTFEWRRGPRRTLLVSVHPEYRVHYAALIGNSRHYGDEPVFDELPARLALLLEQIYAI